MVVIRENKMNISKGTQLVRGFVQALQSAKDIKIKQSTISRNIFEYIGKRNCLLYVKGRAEHPYRWGVTANVIDRLKAQPKSWMVILLFESHDQGYLLSSNDVEHYIQKVWPLAADGDYKPATGSYLSRNTALYSMQEFIQTIEIDGTV